MPGHLKKREEGGLGGVSTWVHPGEKGPPGEGNFKENSILKGRVRFTTNPEEK